MLKAPQLFINEQQCLANIKKMAAKIPAGFIFRPHFKTHQSAKIGNIFKACGIHKITVSSLEMAGYFIENGWQDITLGITCNIHWTEDINLLGQKASLNIVVEDAHVLRVLMKEIKIDCGVFIKVDTGAGRTGVKSSDVNVIDDLVLLLKNSEYLHFKGFLSHAGHTYACKNKEEISEIYFQSYSQMSVLKERYIKDFSNIILSYGDTPSCSVVDNLSHFDEYRPGNFVFYDLMQYEAGVCSYDEIAVSVAAPVIAKHKDRLEIVVHCGAVHLSKEYIEIEGQKVYGEMSISAQAPSLNRAFVKRLSQEHGVIGVNKSVFEAINVGDTVSIMPVHSCLTVHQFANFLK